MSRLDALGYGPFFRNQFKELPVEWTPARVVGQHRREWDVASSEGTQRAVLAGTRWAPDKRIEAADAQPTIGDWVALRQGTPPVISHILERQTSLARTSQAKRGARQLLAANIDLIAVVAAFAHPGADDFAAKRSLSPRRIERYLTAITKGGAEPLVLLNKADLEPSAREQAKDLESRLKDCSVLAVSCVSDNGLAELKERLSPGTTIGFIGLSGVGKSSLVNSLLGRPAQKVGEERVSDARGRHTTTHRELFLADDGFILIDTPGMREFALVGAEEADLEAFSDISAMASQCQFRDCTHNEEPNCAVRAAVKSGELEADRLESYRTLASELREVERKKSVRGTTEGRKNQRKRRRNAPHHSRSGDWDDD